jgi:hypothetical protein
MDYRSKYYKYKTKYLDLKNTNTKTHKLGSDYHFESHRPPVSVKFNNIDNNYNMSRGGRKFNTKDLKFIGNDKKINAIVTDYIFAFDRFPNIARNLLEKDGIKSKFFEKIDNASEQAKFIKITELLKPEYSEITGSNKDNKEILTMGTPNGKFKVTIVPVAIFDVLKQTLVLLFHIPVKDIPQPVAKAHDKLSKSIMDISELHKFGFGNPNVVFENENFSIVDEIMYMYVICYLLGGFGYIKSTPFEDNDNVLMYHIVTDIKK